MSSTGISEAYDGWADSYDQDRNLTRDLDASVTRARLSSVRCARLLEVGCGTGKNTPFYSQISEHVHALDFSPAMLSRAREKVKQKNVEFALVDAAHSWPVRDGSIDLVAFNLVLEHIEELTPVFGRAARCLRTGGVLSISELHPFRQYLGGAARFERDGRTQTIAAFVHHVSDFLTAAGAHGLKLERLEEWWHAEDQGKPPRLITLSFAARSP